MNDAAAPPPPPESPKFTDLGLHPDLLRAVQDMGFERPTPIQAQGIPPVMAGRDVIGCAQTGTGKTAAFVLPILHRLLQGVSRGRVRALVVEPTRELALQSIEELRALGKYVPLKGAAIFGGVPMDPQIRALAQGVDVISATPGRLLDHVYSGRIDFGDLQVLVLDEADRMLDMGFFPDITRIISLLPPKRQNLLYSATMPQPILDLIRGMLRDPLMIQVGQRSAPATGVRQTLYPVPRPRKLDLLTRLLRQDGMDSVLIFTRTKIFADRLTRSLTERGFRVSVMHGDRSQSQRLRALDQFRRGRNSIMVATDIAARGIDIEDISHVVNYDVPHTPENYVHRIGRTARAEATGDAVTLVDASEEPFVTDIERALGRQVPRVTLPDFDYGPADHAGAARHAGRHPGGHPRHGPHGGHGHHAPPRHGGHPQHGPGHPQGGPGGGRRRRRRRRGGGSGQGHAPHGHHGGHGHAPA